MVAKINRIGPLSLDVLTRRPHPEKEGSHRHSQRNFTGGFRHYESSHRAIAGFYTCIAGADGTIREREIQTTVPNVMPNEMLAGRDPGRARDASRSGDRPEKRVGGKEPSACRPRADRG